jgi:ribose/xylose/arabinose/galactoside ABC-type transport system permease subunit
MTALTAARPSWRDRLVDLPLPEIAAPVALVLLVVAFGALDGTFLSRGNIEAVLQASAILVVLAVGQAFVIATGGIDLSVASTMTLGAVVLGQVYATGAGIGWAILAGIAAATAVAWSTAWWWPRAASPTSSSPSARCPPRPASP